jgi:hypothetical protein
MILQRTAVVFGDVGPMSGITAAGWTAGRAKVGSPPAQENVILGQVRAARPPLTAVLASSAEAADAARVLPPH